MRKIFAFNNGRRIIESRGCPAHSLLLATLLLLAGGCGTLSEKRKLEADREALKQAQRQEELAAMKALAQHAEAAVEESGYSIGREFANVLRDGHWQRWLKYMKGEGKKPGWPAEAKAIKDITGWVELIEAADEWPEPGSYRVPFAETTPVIDGVLEKEAWDKAFTYENIYSFNQTEAGGPETTWRIMWDEKYLYFAFECADTDVVAPDRERDDHVYQDDCVEMFILPNPRFRTYWELVIAPNGSIFDAIHCKKLNQLGSAGDAAADMQGLKNAQRIDGTLNQSEDEDTGYTVEIAVPFAELPGFTRCAPEAGDKLHFMLARLDKTQGEFKTYAFRPLQFWGHNIWNHAVMELVK